MPTFCDFSFRYISLILGIEFVSLKEPEKMSFFKSSNHIIDVLDDSLTFSFGSNVTLVSNDEKCFKAHKIVLSASSKLLEDIFSERPREDTNHLIIQ